MEEEFTEWLTFDSQAWLYIFSRKSVLETSKKRRRLVLLSVPSSKGLYMKIQLIFPSVEMLQAYTMYLNLAYNVLNLT